MRTKVRPAQNALFRVLSFSVILSLCLSAFGTLPAFAGDCDGTAGDDDGVSNPIIECHTDPTPPDISVGLDAGDDIYVQDAGVTTDYVGGDALDDGSSASGGVNGDDDTITISGHVTGCVDGDGVDGDGGNDVITVTVTGEVDCSVNGDYSAAAGGDDQIYVNGVVGNITGDYAGYGGNDTIILGATGSVDFDVSGDGLPGPGDGGDDTIYIYGEVGGVVSGDFTILGNGGNDTIVISGEVFDVHGDDVAGNGGDDVIIINGSVILDVTGDCAFGDGGNDTITINGSVGGDVLGDCVGGAGGDDIVTIGSGAHVDGDIDGEDGGDVLQFAFLTQAQLAGLSPSAGFLTYNGETYTWFNFEQLVGLLEELGVRFFYRSNGLAGLALEDGVKVINENGPIAFIHYSDLSSLVAGGPGVMFQGVHAQGWYVMVHNLGAYAGHAGQNLYSVQIYNAAGALMGEFSFGY